MRQPHQSAREIPKILSFFYNAFLPGVFAFLSTVTAKPDAK
jgi:hypothetical protein